MPIAAPVQLPSQGRVLRWGLEDTTWGTKATVIHQEPVSDFTSDDQRDLYNGTEVTGMMTSEISSDELTHYVQGTLTSPFRAGGVTAQSLACMMGSPATDDTPVAAAPHYTHTMALQPFTNRCNTLSLWWQSSVLKTGLVTGLVKCYTASTITSVGLTFGPGGALDTTVGWWGQWAQDDPGTATDFIGASPSVGRDLTRTLGWQGSFTLYGSTGSVYCPRVLSGTLNFTRDAEAVYAADSQTIVDIALGPLTVSGTVVMQFDGYLTGSNAAVTLANDYYNYHPTGDATHLNSMKWTDADGNYVSMNSYKWLWHPFALDFSGQFVKASGTFTARPDPAAFEVATGAILTHVNPLVFYNKVSGPMLKAG